MQARDDEMLSRSARLVARALEVCDNRCATLAELARIANQPESAVESRLQELLDGGYVEYTNGVYHLNPDSEQEALVIELLAQRLPQRSAETKTVSNPTKILQHLSDYGPVEGPDCAKTLMAGVSIDHKGSFNSALHTLDSRGLVVRHKVGRSFVYIGITDKGRQLLAL